MIGIWCHDLSGNVYSLSSQAAHILEFEEVEVHGVSYETVLSRIHPEDRERVSLAFDHFLANKQPTRIECRLLLAQGRIKHIEQSFESLLDQEGNPSYLLGAVLDLTERCELQAQLQDARKALASVARVRSDYLGRVNQGIHGAITGVLGTTELLRETRLSPEQRGAVETIHASARRLLEQGNAVYELSRIDSGQLQLETEQFDLERLAHDQFTALGRRASEKGLELVLDYPPECPRLFWGDADKIGRILYNLLSNGVRFTDVGFVRLSVECEASDGSLRLSVADCGIGIDNGKLRELSRTFEKGGEGEERPLLGLQRGLGLQLTYELVKLMGGRIEAEAVPSRGSSFTIELGLKASEPLPQLTTVFEAKPVLLLEELSESSRVMSRLLESLGLAVDCLKDSEAVLPALIQAVETNRPYELAILNEPLHSSVTTVLGRAIRQLQELSSLKLIAITAQGHRGDAEAFHRAGFDAYINKPVLASSLSGLVKSLLERDPGVSAGDQIITSHQLEPDSEARAGRHHFDGRVLLVESEPTSRHVAHSMLAGLGLTVDLAENGLHAIILSKKIDYDLIFMECKMPDMDVFEAVRVIREQELEFRHPTAPIIALTSASVAEYREECIQAGIAELVAKPYSKFDFILSLQQWLGVQAKPATPLGELSQQSMEATIDLGILERLSEEMAEDFRAVMDAILEEIGDALHKLGGDLRELPGRDLTKLTRSLISLCGNMGAMRLKRMASDLEQVATDGFVHDPGPWIVTMQREFDSVRRFLKEYGY